MDTGAVGFFDLILGMFYIRLKEMMQMIYVIESIIFIAMIYIFNNIRNMKFYTWVLKHNKYTFDVWAQAKESFAYNVTKIVESMPTFSFAPTSWDYYQMRKEV